MQDGEHLDTHDPWPAFEAWHHRRGLSPGTTTKRRLTLRSWLAHVEDWRTADWEDLEQWVDTMAHTSAKVRQDRVSDIRVFYTWARKRGLVDVDPTERWEGPRLPRRLPRPVPWPVVERALDLEHDPRVRLAIALAAYAGLRRKEVAGLVWTDVDLAAGAIYVREGKGGHQRMAFMAPPLRRMLAAQDGVVGPVFPSRYGGHVSPAYVGLMVEASLTRAEGSHRWTMHQLRHSYGCRSLEGGTRLEVLQALMGHQSSDTTRIYARMSAAAILQEAAAGWR